MCSPGFPIWFVVHVVNELFSVAGVIFPARHGFASHSGVPKLRFSVEVACAQPIFTSQPALANGSKDASPLLTDVFMQSLSLFIYVIVLRETLREGTMMQQKAFLRLLPETIVTPMGSISGSLLTLLPT
ncbi:MAG: hypothetical protein ACLQU4_12490 [Limisphaerales bacterium]